MLSEFNYSYLMFNLHPPTNNLFECTVYCDTLAH